MRKRHAGDGRSTVALRPVGARASEIEAARGMPTQNIQRGSGEEISNMAFFCSAHLKWNGCARDYSHGSLSGLTLGASFSQDLGFDDRF